MASATHEITVGGKLDDIYNKAINTLDEIEQTSLPFNSFEYQNQVKRCVEQLEDSTRLVSVIGMFSTNEMIQEIPTEHLRYLLLPYYLGQLSTKILSADRQNALKISEIYYNDFLKRCEEYDIIQSSNDSEVPTADIDNSTRTDDDKMRDLICIASQRNSKIEQYRLMKELEQQIEQLKLISNQSNVDDEIKRDLYMKTINYSILKAKEELCSIKQESDILEFRKHQFSSNQNSNYENDTITTMSSTGNNRHVHKHAPSSQRQPLKPIIITRDIGQKNVFGMGYPSLPVMTVAEFYEERVASGIFPNAAKVAEINKQMLAQQKELKEGGISADKEEAEAEKFEQLEEIDDEENIARLRAKDEYKDEVRRGDGNRHNRS